jgi:predicted P-loop ATPase
MKVKAFASRTHDRWRRVWDREQTDQPRRVILFATTNDDVYLQGDQNRRFWQLFIRGVIDTGAKDREGKPILAIDKERLKRERDQLFGEAAALEATGMSKYWADARVEQDKRRYVDHWEDIVTEALEGNIVISSIYKGAAVHCVVAVEIMTQVLELSIRECDKRNGKRLGRIMRSLGWDRVKMPINGGPPRWCYVRPLKGD